VRRPHAGRRPLYRPRGACGQRSARGRGRLGPWAPVAHDVRIV